MSCFTLGAMDLSFCDSGTGMDIAVAGPQKARQMGYQMKHMTN